MYPDIDIFEEPRGEKLRPEQWKPRPRYLINIQLTLFGNYMVSPAILNCNFTRRDIMKH